MSTKNQTQFEFKYEGDNYIDINTLLTSQFHFLATITEIQKTLHPTAKVSIKIGAFREGSFIVDMLMESSFIKDFFSNGGGKITLDVLAGFASLISIHQYLKGRKAETVEDKGNGNVEIKVDGDKNSIIVNQKVFHIYKSNQTASNSIEKNFELLDADPGITGIVINRTDKGQKENILNVPKQEFKDIAKPNSYLSKEITDETHLSQVLFIKKPNLYPENNKVWNWELMHKGRDIVAKITDVDFRIKINEGLKVGQGDRLIADLKIFYKWNESYMTYVESGKYEIVKVHTIKGREEQSRFI